MSRQQESPSEKRNRFFGKYRGLVIENIDPEQIGRVLVQVPDVLGETPSSWAMPCVPAAGIQSGCFIVPPIGSQVWVEFEQGDPDYPIWTGCFWGSAAELPALARISPPGVSSLTFQTTLQNGIVINDVPGAGGIILKSASGAGIVINDTGIIISNGQGAVITLVGPQMAITNGQALNLKFLPETTKPSAFAHTIEAYFRNGVGKTGVSKTGGLQIQFNIIDRETLKDWVKHPEKYPHQIVRVSGYTAYFQDLNPQMQQEIIDRAEYDLATGHEVP